MSRGPGSCMASLCLCWLKTLFLKFLLILTGTRRQCHSNLLESVKTAAHYNQPVFISLVLERHPHIPVWDRQPNRGSNCSEYIFQPSDSLVAYRSKSLCVTVQIAFLPCLCAGLELAKNVSKAAFSNAGWIQSWICDWSAIGLILNLHLAQSQWASRLFCASGKTPNHHCSSCEKFVQLPWDTHWPGTILKPLTADVNNKMLLERHLSWLRMYSTVNEQSVLKVIEAEAGKMVKKD